MEKPLDAKEIADQARKGFGISSMPDYYKLHNEIAEHEKKTRDKEMLTNMINTPTPDQIIIKHLGDINETLKAIQQDIHKLADKQ